MTFHVSRVRDLNTAVPVRCLVENIYLIENPEEFNANVILNGVCSFPVATSMGELEAPICDRICPKYINKDGPHAWLATLPTGNY